VRKKLLELCTMASVFCGFLVFLLLISDVEVVKKNGTEAAIFPAPIIYLPTLINAAPPVKFTHDFETGDLTGWEKTGTSFDFQPTFGDNPTARARGQPSQHQGEWWIGCYEKYQGKGGEVAGAIQGDAPLGTLTSIEFKIIGDTINFLIGAGNHPWVEPNGTGSTCVNLEINGEMVKTMTGANTETMARREWDVSDLKNKRAVIKIYDENSGGWGHPNFDDVWQARNGKNIPWESQAIDAFGRLPTTLGKIKSK